MSNLYKTTFLLACALCANLTILGNSILCDQTSHHLKEYKFNFVPIEIVILNWDELALQFPNLALNDNILSRTDSGIFTFDSDDLLVGQNKLSAVPDLNSLDGVSTLDLVLLYKGLSNREGLSPPMAISGDIDKSGSVTTKDLFHLRKTILGLENADNLGQPFLIRKTDMISEIDMFDFENNYDVYFFEHTELQDISRLEFELFQYGNLSEAESEFHKSDEIPPIAEFAVVDKDISKDEVFDVSLQLEQQYSGRISGAGWKLSHPDLELINVSSSSSGTELMWNDVSDKESTFSYLPVKDQKTLNVKLTFKAKNAGQLSKLLLLDQTFQNERISETFQSSTLELAFSNLVQTKNEIKVFPNPTSEKLYLMKSNVSSNYEVLIYNNLGQLVLADRLVNTSLELHLDHVQSGQLLLVHFINEEEHIIKKVFTK